MKSSPSFRLFVTSLSIFACMSTSAISPVRADDSGPKQAIEKAGQQIKDGAQKLGEDVKNGAEQAAAKTEEFSKDAANTLKDAYQKVANEAERFGKMTEEEVRKVFTETENQKKLALREAHDLKQLTDAQFDAAMAHEDAMIAEAQKPGFKEKLMKGFEAVKQDLKEAGEQTAHGVEIVGHDVQAQSDKAAHSGVGHAIVTGLKKTGQAIGIGGQAVGAATLAVPIVFGKNFGAGIATGRSYDELDNADLSRGARLGGYITAYGVAIPSFFGEVEIVSLIAQGATTPILIAGWAAVATNYFICNGRDTSNGGYCATIEKVNTVEIDAASNAGEKAGGAIHKGFVKFISLFHKHGN